MPATTVYSFSSSLTYEEAGRVSKALNEKEVLSRVVQVNGQFKLSVNCLDGSCCTLEKLNLKLATIEHFKSLTLKA